jgi:hypothetical protein
MVPESAVMRQHIYSYTPNVYGMLAYTTQVAKKSPGRQSRTTMSFKSATLEDQDAENVSHGYNLVGSAPSERRQKEGMLASNPDGDDYVLGPCMG